MRTRKSAAQSEQVYQFIREYLSEHGYSPSLREIAAACGLGMTALMRHLDRLEVQGRIVRVPRQARSIRLPGGEE